MRKRIKYAKLLCSFLLVAVMLAIVVPMEARATEDSNITGTSYTVTGNVTNLTFSGAAKATEGQDYTATISNNGGCQPPSAISVTVGGVQLTSGSTTYTYNVQNGLITIKGEAITGNIIVSASATAHQWGQDNIVVVGPSCTQQGSQGKYCQVCGMTTGGGAVAATGHKFVNYVSNGDATCGKDGTKTAICSNPGCSATNTVTDNGSRLQHTSVGKRVNTKVATCTEEGYTGELLCTCGAVVKYGEKIPVTEHSEMLIGKQNPSCIVDGYTGDMVCRYCDVVLSTGTEIPRYESHSYSEWKTILEATDVKIGRKERVCTVCGIKESQLIPASQFGGYILPICILVLITGAGVGVGFAVYYAIKKLKTSQNSMENTPGETIDEVQNDAIVVAPETGSEENF